MSNKPQYNFGIEEELSKMLSEELSKEIDKEILKNIMKLNKKDIWKRKIEKILNLK